MKAFFDVLSSRLVIAATLFALLFIGGAYLIGQYRYATDAVESTTSEKSVTVKSRRKATASTPVRHPQPNYEASPEEKVSSDDSESETEVKSLPDSLTAEEVGFDTKDDQATLTDERVSPFGFGPYPEVPDGYPLSVSWLQNEEQLARSKEICEMYGIDFAEDMKLSELMTRVGIKLWNEGNHFGGLSSEDGTGRIYPNFPDVIYVEWRETTDKDGNVRRYPSSITGSAISALSIAAQQGREPFPDWLEVRSMEDGIDPYEFLGLNY